MTDAAYAEEEDEDEDGLSQPAEVGGGTPHFEQLGFWNFPRKSMKCSLVVFKVPFHLTMKCQGE